MLLVNERRVFWRKRSPAARIRRSAPPARRRFVSGSPWPRGPEVPQPAADPRSVYHFKSRVTESRTVLENVGPATKSPRNRFSRNVLGTVETANRHADPGRRRPRWCPRALSVARRYLWTRSAQACAGWRVPFWSVPFLPADSVVDRCRWPC